MDTVRKNSGTPEWMQGAGQSTSAATFVTNVLVVDEDQSIRETLRLMLEDSGYAVTEAPNGLAALEVLRASGQSYVVLVDLMMPQLDGAGFLGIVAEDPALEQQHTYILMTADNQGVHRLMAMLLTRLMVPVVLKPFDIDILLARVEAAAQRLAPAERRATDGTHGGPDGRFGHWPQRHNAW